MTSVTVGLIQLDCSDKETPEARTTRALEMTNDTAGDVDLVLLPELWQAGAFNMAAIKECATAVDSTLTNEFRKIAVRHGTWIHAGSLVEQVGEQLFNTAVVIDPSGAITSTYRKIHLYGFDQGEATTMTAGSDVVIADTLLGPTGISTCYDLRFPELYRHQVDRGAQTFLSRRAGRTSALNTGARCYGHVRLRIRHLSWVVMRWAAMPESPWAATPQ